MKERIHKVLANAGVDSRRKVEEMVRQGRVAVNGKVLTELPILIDPARDRVTVDDEPVRIKPKQSGRRLYFLLNKPKGVYSTNVAQGVQKRAIDLLPPELPGRVYPVGRLDAESKGLLLLTNDGELTNQLTHPRYGVSKTYRAVIEGYIEPETAERLQKGVWLADEEGKGFKTGRSRIKIVKRAHDYSVLEITIREGRNRQVRRVLAKLGHRVRDLTRIRFGPLTLEGLGLGRFRPLTPPEVKALKQFADRGPVPAARETRPAARETRPAARETRPAARETRPAARETRPAARETRPAAREIRPAARETRPAARETRPAAREIRNPKSEIRNKFKMQKKK